MRKQEINEDFIDSLRTTTSIMIWTYEETEQTEIVPEELTHHYLLENFDIDHSVYKFYHLSTQGILSYSKLQEMKDCGLLDKDGFGLWPYSNIIYGASHSRGALSLKLWQAAISSRTIKLNGKRIKYFEDLLPYFKEYANGFADGFNEFDNKQIKPFLTMFAEKQDYVNKVFEFITKIVEFDHNWALNIGFITNGNNEIVNAFKDGQKQGFFYRAWSFVFSNNTLFAPLFQEHFKTLLPQPNAKTKTELPEKLSDLITHKKSIDIVDGIKIQYKNIKGKRLKLLLMAFQDLGLLPKERMAQKFYDCCKIEFKWEIASYNAMNGYEYNDSIDNVEFSRMKQYLETLIKAE